ncbi:MAG: MATE family efflux transporter, partial [Alphaproteobacteria bacterium]|nr:MATE family efflux transporter [Alphaproteobacteria bacterium]
MSKHFPLAAHLRATVVLGLPLIGTNLAQMALHLVDTVMLGWYGVTPLAAVVIGASSFFVVFILGSGFAQAVMPMVAQALAAQDDAQVRRDVRMGLWLSLAYAALAYPLFWNASTILLHLGQKPEVVAAAQDFLRVAGVGLIPALVVMVLKNLTAAVQRAGVALWVTVAAVGLNAVINWALVFGHWGAPELGVRGAAIASVSVQTASALALWLYAVWAPELRRFHLWQRFWRPDWAALRRVFRLGWPIGVTGLAESALFHASALMMGWVGTVELAAHGIAIEVAALA